MRIINSVLAGIFCVSTGMIAYRQSETRYKLINGYFDLQD